MIKYFYSDGRKKGPVTLEQLKKKNIQKETLIWYEGLDDWKPAKEIRELDEIFELNPAATPKIKCNTGYKSSDSKSVRQKESSHESTYADSSDKHKQRMFSRAFSFKGRIRRTEYGLSLIIFSVIFVFVCDRFESEGVYYMILPLLPFVWFITAQTWKRQHDLGISGWNNDTGTGSKIIFVFHRGNFSFKLLFKEGQIGPNKYGEDPKN